MFDFYVQGMKCGGCAGRITRAIQALDTNAQIHVDLVTRKVSVSSDAPLKDLEAALSEAGYPVTSGAAE